MRAEWDKLSALLEDEKAGNDAIRDAAVALCAALEEHRVYPKVSDKCPSCGGTSLFRGDGGFVTCSRIDCKEPSVGRATEAIVKERDAWKARVASDGEAYARDMAKFEERRVKAANRAASRLGFIRAALVGIKGLAAAEEDVEDVVAELGALIEEWMEPAF